MLDQITSTLYTKVLVKNKPLFNKFVAHLIKRKLDTNIILLYPTNAALMGFILDWLESDYNIGIHVDHSCYIVYFIDINKVSNAVFPFYKRTGFTPYIFEWYADSPEGISTVMINYDNAISYVINRLLNPF